MLQSIKGIKPRQITITHKVWDEAKKNTLNGIEKKISAAETIVHSQASIDIAASLYTYALEEFGKLLLLRNLPKIKSSNRRNVNYKNEFACHDKKFELAFDYLQNANHGYCLILNDRGSFSPKSSSWRSFDLGLLADFNARLSLLYTDFKYHQGGIILEVHPSVNKDYLIRAIRELRSAVQELNMSST
ncbi:MAG TPA: AbiV family abortive infection protein [Nitrososphaera sp.]|nr:AbiV family abortive infection protein [Nitrososphaera sp.]